jgi:hypothetical protein
LTNAKLADLSASSRLKGSASTAPDATDITLGAGLEMTNSTLAVNTLDLIQVVNQTPQTLANVNDPITFSSIECQSPVPSIITYDSANSTFTLLADYYYSMTFTCSSLKPVSVPGGDESITISFANTSYGTWVNSALCTQSYSSDYGLHGSTEINSCFKTLADSVVQVRVKNSPTSQWTITDSNLIVQVLF